MLRLQDRQEKAVGVEMHAALADQFMAAVQVGLAGAPAVAEPAPFQFPARDCHRRSQGTGGERHGRIRPGYVRGHRHIEGLHLPGDTLELPPQRWVGDAGVDHCHVERGVAEQRGDGGQVHAAVDGLGGEGVAPAVGMGVGHTCPLGDAVDDRVAVGLRDAAPLACQQVGGPGRWSGEVSPLAAGALGGQEGIQGGLQFRADRDIAVVAQLAQGHTQPWLGGWLSQAPEGDHIGELQVARLAHPQPTAGQQFDDETFQ